ncbi:hypothetical protein SORBI_3004G258900 [Sorghum bicolor]|uniref:Uncharacterized protein n=1 Tax=Sorghum bicolor TaxID=4558 RepID=A0A194YRL4_SORBI|nr:hypothetical protein SORBI_3004G258900 [Sorghum bicolor]
MQAKPEATVPSPSPPLLPAPSFHRRRMEEANSGVAMLRR